MSTFLPVVTRPRPVDPEWACHRSGDCCRSGSVVVMTEEEQAVLLTYGEKHFTLKKLSTLKFSTDGTGMVGLAAGPCPLLEMVDGKPTCTVHDVRPFTCRRFGCLRPNPKTEPLQMAPITPMLTFGNIGCVNVRERLVQSREARRTYEKLQRKAQRWGRAHGWVD